MDRSLGFDRRVDEAGADPLGDDATRGERIVMDDDVDPGSWVHDVIGEEIGHCVCSGVPADALSRRERSAPVAVLLHRRSCRGASRSCRRAR